MARDGSYEVAGPPDALAIVLVHGTRLSRASWRPQIDDLSDEFRVIAIDLPGHGSLAVEPFTMDGAVGRLTAVIDEAAGGRAVVVGLSLGGYVAMDLAARSPDRVAGLVLAGASQEPVGPWTLPYRALGLLLRRGPRPLLTRFDTWFFRMRFPPRISGPLLAGGSWPRGGASALSALLGHRFLDRLATYPGPTLILNGSLDIVFRLGERAFLAAARDGRRVVIPRATHLVNLDRPNLFNDAVRAFARSVVKAGREGKEPS
jgi:pimeloyl-ACP methyl ester carboxylesterase